MEPEDPALAIAARHALHDEELVAAYATDGDAAADPARARSLIERCAACRDLHADLVAIGGILRASPRAETVSQAQPAPRDFRLSIETANRLRPGSVVIRSRNRLADLVASFSRPVGLSMASLGVVGLLLGTLTLGGPAGLALAPGDNGGPGAGGATAAPVLSTEGTGELTGTSGTPVSTTRASFGTRATASAPSLDSSYQPGSGGIGGPTLSTLVVVGSTVLLIGGLALLVVGSRRREPIPGS
jgi:hypothetical protein